MDNKDKIRKNEESRENTDVEDCMIKSEEELQKMFQTEEW
jgi:hypothetical protein